MSYIQETTRNNHPSSHHMEPHREEAKRDTPGERWRGWPRTENDGVPWSMAYAPSEQTGVNSKLGISHVQLCLFVQSATANGSMSSVQMKRWTYHRYMRDNNSGYIATVPRSGEL